MSPYMVAVLVVAVLSLLANVIVPICTFRAGLRRGRALTETDPREDRIVAFVREYAKNSLNALSSGFDGIRRAGVTELKSDSEIREALDRCVAAAGHYPLPRHGEDFQGVDLRDFFMGLNDGDWHEFAMHGPQRALEKHAHGRTPDGAVPAGRR